MKHTWHAGRCTTCGLFRTTRKRPSMLMRQDRPQTTTITVYVRDGRPLPQGSPPPCEEKIMPNALSLPPDPCACCGHGRADHDGDNQCLSARCLCPYWTECAPADSDGDAGACEDRP